MPRTDRLLEAVHLATTKLSHLSDIDAALRDVLAICAEAVGAESGTIYLHDANAKTLRFHYVFPEEVAQRIERHDIPDDFGVAGEVFQTGRIKLSEYPEGGDPRTRGIGEKTGLVVRTMITAPLQIADMQPIGVVQLVNKKGGDFNETDVLVLDTVSDVSTLALANAQLLERSTRVASLEGMGRAAHDMANKAGVLVTFLPDFERSLDSLDSALAEDDAKMAKFHADMLRGTFEDVFAPYSDRVFRYARLVNDLGAGKKLEPKRRPQSFAHAVISSVSYLATKARQDKIDIEYDLQGDAPDFCFDELYVTRIAENLVGNAIKAATEVIPEQWLRQHASEDDESFYDRVLVSYKFDGKNHVLEVRDNGPGMDRETVDGILQGEARSRWSRNTGSGLGTKVVMELARSHSATVSIESEPGCGTVFRVSFPHDETACDPA